MNKFYDLMWDKRKGEVLVKSLKDHSDKDIQDLKVGNLTVLEPFIVKVSQGSRFYDIVHFEDPFNFAISEKIYTQLIEAGTTGWKSFEVIIEGKSEKYYGFQVVSRCGPLKRPEKAGFLIGMEFDHNTWDGSDFFCPMGTLSIFCTEKAKLIIEANKINNTILSDIETLEWYSN